MNSENAPNQVSEGPNELHQDGGAQSLEGGVNKTLEALGAVNRAQITKRKETLS